MRAYAIKGYPAQNLRAAVETLSQLHDLCDQYDLPQRSLDACIISSQISATVLKAVGFDASLVSCQLVALTCDDKGAVTATRSIGSLTGAPYKGQPSNMWNGHMVVAVDGFVLDPTFWQADKTNTDLPVMFMLPQTPQVIRGRDVIARTGMTAGSKRYELLWMPTPRNVPSPSTTDPARATGLAAVVRQLIAEIESSTAASSRSNDAIRSA